MDTVGTTQHVHEEEDNNDKKTDGEVLWRWWWPWDTEMLLDSEGLLVESLSKLINTPNSVIIVKQQNNASILYHGHVNGVCI